jgi:ABC-type branched-subunit amino acid transport system substrate-binding protein
VLLAIAVLTLAGAAAACGDDSGSSGSGGATDDSLEASGPSVKVVAIIDESESAGFTNDAIRVGLEAGQNGVNERGGIGADGLQIEVEICATNFEAQPAEQCARDAVADDSVVATISNASNQGDVINPILEDAGLASLAPVPVSPSDFINPISFPIESGAVTAGGAAALAADELDATQIKAGLLDVAGAEQGALLADAVLSPRGLSLEETVTIPIDKPDLSAEAAQLSTDSDAIIPIVEPNTLARLVSALAQMGSDVPISAASPTAPDSTLRELGDDAEGMYIAAGLATNDMPGEWVTQSVEEIQAIDEDAATDDNAKNAWASLNVLAQLMDGAQTIDRASVLAALNAADDIDTHGLTPNIDFTEPGTEFGGAVPRLVNPTVVYARWEDGELTALTGKFVNPFDAP